MAEKNKRPIGNLNTWIKFSNIGLQMAAVIAFAVWAGTRLDGKFPDWQPFFTVTCSLSGVFGSLYWVIVQVKKMQDKER
ncbi:MAG: AtpZ/AtpI family protein [Capnocytophaga sp.]|nr:AtpZ/AtpI family protein [Capnocytophaga sp.]